MADGSLVVGFAQGYDAVGNRVFEEKLHDPERSERWSHDSAYRLTSFERGTLGAYTLGAQVVTEVADATPAVSASLAARTWQLDGEGSWRAGTERWVDALGNQIGADFSRATSPAHEYLRETRSEGPPGGPLTVSTTAYLHDPSGNLVEDGRFVYLWDALGRLAEVQRPTGEVVARYAYDAFSRRVRKEVTAQALDPTLAGVTLYLHDASQVIEELVSSDPASVPFATARQYVYGRGIDQPVALDRYQAGAGSAPLDLDQLSLVDLGAGVTTQVHRLYYATNALQSVFALTDTAPADAGAGDPGAHLVEAAEYDPYGAHTLYAPAAGQASVAFDGSDAASSYAAADRAVRSRYDNPYLFTGRRFDPETGLLHYRNRYYDPLLGQFLSQDPTGYADGLNLYEYVGGNPLNAIDPHGYMAQALAGAVAGAAIEGAMGAVGTLLAGGSLTDAAIEGGIGALSGAIRCGLTCAGLPPPLSGAISAAVSAALRTGAKAIRKAMQVEITGTKRAVKQWERARIRGYKARHGKRPDLNKCDH